MTDKLLKELLKLQESPSVLTIKIGSEEFTFRYKYMTIFEDAQIKHLSKKTRVTYSPDGTPTEREELQEHLVPIYTVLIKSLNEDGSKVFNPTNPKDFDIVKQMPYGALSQIAVAMSLMV